MGYNKQHKKQAVGFCQTILVYRKVLVILFVTSNVKTKKTGTDVWIEKTKQIVGKQKKREIQLLSDHTIRTKLPTRKATNLVFEYKMEIIRLQPHRNVSVMNAEMNDCASLKCHITLLKKILLVMSI